MPFAFAVVGSGGGGGALCVVVPIVGWSGERGESAAECEREIMHLPSGCRCRTRYSHTMELPF